MRRLLLIAMLGLAAPAAAHERGFDRPMDEGSYVLPSAPHHGRTFVYLGHDDRWGPRVFSRDDGYFQGRGGGVGTANGRALYDYDRDYPYDFPQGWGAEEAFSVEEGEPELECRIELVPDRRSGTAEVRICS